MLYRSVAALILSLLALPVHARTLPSLVPDGWSQEVVDAETRTRRFVSPDGRSSLTSRQTQATRANPEADMNQVAFRAGEQITYQRRGSSWLAVSGYKGGDIFYRKSNLACGGTRWNQIELLYPREHKRAMDAIVTRIAHGMTMYGTDCD
jgi:hypothetical protein